MRQRRTCESRLLEWQPILLVAKNVFNGAQAIGAEPLCAHARGFQPVRAMDAAEPHQAETRAIALLRMLPAK